MARIRHFYMISDISFRICHSHGHINRYISLFDSSDLFLNLFGPIRHPKSDFQNFRTPKFPCFLFAERFHGPSLPAESGTNGATVAVEQRTNGRGGRTRMGPEGHHAGVGGGGGQCVRPGWVQSDEKGWGAKIGAGKWPKMHQKLV